MVLVSESSLDTTATALTLLQPSLAFLRSCLAHNQLQNLSVAAVSSTLQVTQPPPVSSCAHSIADDNFLYGYGLHACKHEQSLACLRLCCCEYITMSLWYCTNRSYLQKLYCSALMTRKNVCSYQIEISVGVVSIRMSPELP